MFFLIIGMLFSGDSLGSEPPWEPMLRVEAGMHTARLTQIAVDEKERFLVTGSLDKTVRVWELSTGRLLRILRPPVCKGNEGVIYAVTISPDGETIACGGWTDYGWNTGGKNLFMF